MSANKRLCQLVAEENQLLMEKKWIKEALAKIKTQRNCLQIERLVLESMKSKEKTNSESPQNSSMPNSEHKIQFTEQTPRLDYDEEACNNEELNLDMAMFSNMNPNTSFMEEEEDDSPENVVIDVNMLMYGDQ